MNKWHNERNWKKRERKNKGIEEKEREKKVIEAVK